jgi:transcriptional regulator with XRE-family HTH domain
MGAPTPATDGGAEARRLARRYLGLADNDERLPARCGAELARLTGWSQAYVSNILRGKRRLTPAMRAKLEQQ